MRTLSVLQTVLLVSTALLLLVLPCSADLYQVTVTGTVNNVDNDAGLLDDSVQVGVPYTYTWLYDTAAMPTINLGQFGVSNGMFGATVICGDYVFKPGFPQFSPGYPTPTYAYQEELNEGDVSDDLSTISFQSDAIAESSNPNAPPVLAGVGVGLFYNQPLPLNSLPPLSLYNSYDPQCNSGSMLVSLGPLYGSASNAACFFTGTVDSVSAIPVVPPTPVLLVHGIWGSASNWTGNIGKNQSLIGMASTLQLKGYNVQSVDFPNEPETMSNVAPIEDQAKALSRRIGTLIASSSGKPVNLVCHSMGGLAARYYLEHPELWQKDSAGNIFPGVFKLIMIGTPNWGVDTMLLNPVGTVAHSHANTLPHRYALDTFDHYSVALQEMFSEWEPSPSIIPSEGAHTYGYPTKFALTPYLQSNGGFVCPISGGTYLYDAYVLSNPFISTDAEDKSAIADAEAEFPRLDTRLRLINQEKYYSQQVKQLGEPCFSLPYLGDSPVEGVNFRYVSPFLLSLNSTLDLSAVPYYLLAGDEPTSLDYGEDEGLYVEGPFNPILPNDGAVPVKSVFGIDPLSGTSLFSTTQLLVYSRVVDEEILNVDHHNEPNDIDVIAQVEQWLAR